MNKYIIIALLFITFSTSAQLYKKHDWEEKPTFVKLEEDEKNAASFAIKEKYLIQYFKPVIGNFRLFETKHSIIRVVDEKGISRHNRVYIPTRNVVNVIDIKARVILEDGTVKLLNRNNIKELKNVENYGSYKIFAIEGLEKNSQLEVIYTLEKSFRSLGFVIVQKDYKVKNAEVIIRKPRVLQSRMKTYNGFPKMSLKTVEGNKEAYTANIKNIKAMIDEASAAPDANRMKVSYQVAPKFMSNGELWSNFVSNINYNFTSIKVNKYRKLTQDFDKYTKNMPKTSDSEIINSICDYVNSNFNIIRERNDDLDNLQTAIKKKQASEYGILKVYSCLLSYSNIKFQIVFSCDRFNHKFDNSFFSNLNLQDVLFYFPDEKKFIEPHYVNTRLGFAPFELISNEAIFIGKSSLDYKEIPVPDSQKTIIKRDFDLKLDFDLLETEVNCNHEISGYRASNVRGAYKYLRNRDLNEFKNFTSVSGIEDANIKSFEVENEDFSLNTKNTPFKLKYTYTTEILIDEAGDDLMLNFGKIIGPQNEFYQEIERVNPIELNYLMKYYYTIKIEIPEGYSPKNIEDININEVLKIGDEVACKFVSKSSIQDNTIVIDVIEAYNKLKMDVDHYNGYKDVVNAAFDFSKISIIFEKK